MKVTIYTKSAGSLEVDLKEGVKLQTVGTTDGANVGSLIQVGETEEGPVIVQREEVIAVVPGGLPPPA